MKPIRPLLMRQATASGLVLVGESGVNPSVNAGQCDPGYQIGTAFQAAVSGTAHTFNVHASSARPSTGNFRLCVYAASSESSWGGALLGSTAVQNALSTDEILSVPLLSPIPITAGDWYALTLQAESSTIYLAACDPTVEERYFADAYSDGPASTADASSLNSPNGICAWLTA